MEDPNKTLAYRTQRGNGQTLLESTEPQRHNPNSEILQPRTEK